ncbi:family 16 glycoside hydrolase [Chitinophaga solisilvae]|uniref:family 16 glycoside hydrolase n=1 Tax=Chitinophaga solisilvae TaxID=1233460 RepID=UPI001F2212BF|nr:family 16 glycoside hydrolase [Chitinophaga solisilvae]
MLRWNEFRPKSALLCSCSTLVMLAGIGGGQRLTAQTRVPLTDLSAFKQPSSSWRIAGDVRSDLQQDNTLTTTTGTGILVNLPEKGTHGRDLFSMAEHGDMDLELDYLVARKSNSGIYLQGRYEIQLLDSHGTLSPRAADNGGIYERWDYSKPEGQQGYDGHAPRQNASLANGLWQHLKISFQAPRFDAAGHKIANAVILRAELNGVTIHENVVLSGPTRGAMDDKEAATGPLRLQGDHGAVAFRNITISHFSAPKPELKDITYDIFRGPFDKQPDFRIVKPVANGQSELLTSNVSHLPENQFLIRYQGVLSVKTAGRYGFRLHTSGGGGQMKVNGQEVIKLSGWDGNGAVTLQPGDYPVEILYNKEEDWAKPSLTLSVKGDNLREFVISDVNVPADDATDQILVAATENTVLRSFMDLKGGPRVVHAVSAGSPLKLHYTYDMDHGEPVQAWRGEFLNTTPMWHDRGDGSSRPMGMIRTLDRKPQLSLARLAGEQAAWTTDTAGTGFRPRGYSLDAAGQPVFSYDIYGTQVTDALSILPESAGLQRTIRITRPQENIYVRIAVGDSIIRLDDKTFLVGDKSWYVKMNPESPAAIIRGSQGNMELIAPVKETLRYAIIF